MGPMLLRPTSEVKSGRKSAVSPLRESKKRLFSVVSVLGTRIRMFWEVLKGDIFSDATYSMTASIKLRVKREGTSACNYM